MQLHTNRPSLGKKSPLFWLILVFFNFTHAQKFNVELGFNRNQYKMEAINSYYIDAFASQAHINILQEHINSGNQALINISYRPSGLLDFGLYASYQSGGAKGYPVTIIYDNIGSQISCHKGCLELDTRAFSFGLSNTWYISHLLKFQEKQTTLNRVHLGIELMGGYGFSDVQFEMYYPTYTEIPIMSLKHSANAFQGQLGFKLEYDFVLNPIITSLGIRGGYQYFRTGNVKNKLDQEWVVLGEYPINLDFSGFYFGVFLKLGR